DCRKALHTFTHLSRALLKALNYFAFFFSSRRRHTRFSRDWSSDVCSSDLWSMAISGLWSMAVSLASAPAGSSAVWAVPSKMPERSEERRVGKESRFQRPPSHQKQQTPETKFKHSHIPQQRHTRRQITRHIN